MKKSSVENFQIISFNYKNLSLEERERFLQTGYRDILEKYHKKKIIKGYVAVETCLRVELYLDVSEDFHIGMLQRDFNSKNDKNYKGKEGVEYLLKVICGLESVIKGEDQIMVQLKKAYFKSFEVGKSSPLLNIIFNSSIEAGKRFRNESRINERNVSLDSIAVKFIKSKISPLKNKKIFIIGIGDLSQAILALLHKSEKCHLTMTNRSFRKSVEIQQIFEGVKMVEFREKYKLVKESDVIVSATSAPHLVLIKEKMEDILNDGKKRFFLDLAVPKDIDVEIGKNKNVLLYHLEDIWDEYNKNVEKRDEIVEKYYYIIDKQLEKIVEKIWKRDIYLQKGSVPERRGINGF